MNAMDSMAWLKNQAQKYATKYGYKRENLEKGLELFGLHVLAQDPEFADEVLNSEDTENVDLSEYACGGKGDLRIDGILVNPSTGQSAFLQASWQSKYTGATDEKASAFFNSLEDWANHDLIAEKANDQTRALLNDIDLSADRNQVSLYFLTSLKTGDKSKLHQIAQQAEDRYSSLGWSISCKVLGPSELQQLDAELKNISTAGIAEEVVFEISPKSCFVIDSPQRVLVSALKGNTVSRIYHTKNIQNKLFNQNIRSALVGKLNTAIADTARDPEEAPYFFYYNNGITATCSSFEFVDGSDSKIRCFDLQIVNGAQTVSQLARALRKSEQNSDVLVMFRLIETGQAYRKKSQLADKITKYQNTQNPVKASDFYSNDVIQDWLHRALPDLTSGKGQTAAFYYQNKRGPRPAGAAGFAVSIEQLAKYRHSLLWGPATSYNSPRAFWEPDRSEYWRAFGADGKESSSWPEEQLWEAAWALSTVARFRAKALELRTIAKDAGEVSLEGSYLQYMSIYAMAVAAQGVRELVTQEKISNFKELLTSPTLFAKYQATVELEVRRKLKGEVERRAAARETNPKFYLSRDESSFSTMSKSLRTDIRDGLVVFPG